MMVIQLSFQALLHFGVPAYQGVLLIIGLGLLSIPVLIGGSLRFRAMPAVPNLAEVTPYNPLIPRSVMTQIEYAFYYLKGTGLAEITPWLTNSTGTFYVVFQNPGTTDVLVFESDGLGRYLRCLRERSDGSWLETSMAVNEPPWPSFPRDDSVFVLGADHLAVWRLHQARVKRDPLVKLNSRVTDPLAFQLDQEKRKVGNLIAMGYLEHVNPERLRVTFKGAAMMAFRGSLPGYPWLWWRGRRALATAKA